MATKVSLAVPNIANNIALHVAERFPTLAKRPIAGVWFTGSNVWSFTVGIDPRPNADWDIFALTESIAHSLILTLDLNSFPACKTKDKLIDGARRVDYSNIPRNLNANGEPHVAGPRYGDGFCYFTPNGEVDVWISNAESAIDELQSYPEASHAHCRAAFSFTGGLVMLPNTTLKVAP